MLANSRRDNSASEFNSPRKPTGNRMNRAEVARLRAAIVDFVETNKPVTVRQVFYAMTVQGLVDKSDKGPGDGYGNVQRQLQKLRESGVISWDDVVDHTRWIRRPLTWDSPSQAVRSLARGYRRDPWSGQTERVWIWCEKNALASIIEEITREFAVPFSVGVGFTSDSYAHKVVKEMVSDGGHVVQVYEFGDHDPSGVKAGKSAQRPS